MSKTRKVLTFAMAVCLLVAISIGATVAYLTDYDQVVNTFSVGNVAITLDEAKVGDDGKAITTAARVTENKYHLLPGGSYDKDPTVHVDTEITTEDCWLFVKVENDIADIESKETGYTSIADQITTTYGWKALDGVSGVYYKAYVVDGDSDFVVFDSFKIAGDVENNELASYETTDTNEVSITVTAYAVQKAGFESSAKDAWDKTFGNTAA